jgi:hypothetical protein
VTEDNEDYLLMLSEYGLLEELVRTLSEYTGDLIPLPPGRHKFRIGASQIEGRGILATAAISAGEVVAPARIGSMRTAVGRYTNHSARPNGVMVRRPDNDIDLVAVDQIIEGEEITVNYRQVFRTVLEELK